MIVEIRRICQSLPHELQVKAQKELNEDPKRVQEDIAYIKEWIKQQPYLNARTDDQWILVFLRGCKFSLERTKEKLDMFYTMRTILPEFFKNRDPMLPEIQKILNLGIYLPLPKSKDPDSPKVIYLRNAGYDPKMNIYDLFKVNMMIQDILIMEDDQLVIAGQSMVQDMKGITMNHMIQFTPAMAKKAMTCFQTAYPVRPKNSHIINIPPFFETLHALFRPFLTEKMKRRMNIYSLSYDKMFEDVPQSLLPKEFGGEAGTLEELTAYWKKKVESYREWFLEDAKYGTDESKRPGKPKTSDNVFGLEGSFRKLNVD